MTVQMEMTERFARGLAEFSELCMVSARDLVATQVAATDPAEKAACAGSLHRVGRSMRQSMALEARLRRDLELAGREAQVRSAKALEDRLILRKAQVNATVERLIWTEAEDDREAERLCGELSDLLDEESLAEDFGGEPLEDHIARMCETLKLGHRKPPARDEDDQEYTPVPNPWRGSG